MLKKGTGIETLFKEVEKPLSRKTILNAPSIDINIRKDEKDEMEWTLSVATKNRAKNYKGTGLKKLYSNLEKHFSDLTFRITPEAMCLVDHTANSVTYLVCSPEVEELKKGVINLEKVMITVTPYELSRCLETRIALYDGMNVYPICEQAKSIVGAYTDAVASFKSIAEIPMGAAMLLGEKIAEYVKLDILYEESKSRIKPLMSMCGQQYVQTNQVDFIRAFLEEVINQQFFFNDKNCYWTIENGVTNLFIPLSGMNVNQYSYQPVIKIAVSETPGARNTITLYAKVGNGFVYLCSNAEEKVRIKTGKKRDMSMYFRGFKEELDSFETELDKEIYLSDDVKKTVAGLIGMKRYDIPEEIDKVTLRDFIKLTYKELPSLSQRTKLMKYYRNM